MFGISQKGDFRKTTRFLTLAKRIEYKKILDRYGKLGVIRLQQATPIDTGHTADAWDYEVVVKNNNLSIFWTNSNINEGVQIAVILQYGYGTRNGGYVEGRDYINPALQPLFDDIVDDAWKEITRL